MTNTDDSGTGSLRWAIENTASPGTIDFDAGLSGETIVLQSRIQVSTPDDLVVDGSSVANGITISGDAGVVADPADNVRIFMVGPGATLNLLGLTLADGRSPDGSPGSSGGDGGAIFNEGVLYVSDCTLRDNTCGDGSPAAFLGQAGGRGGHGGAIWSNGTLVVTGSTFVDNSTGNGADGTTGFAADTGGAGGDGDTVPFGVEHALGTDPLVAHRLHPRHLQSPVFNGDECDIRFGLNDAARPHMIWILKRSPDLSPGSFVEVYRFHGPSGVATVQSGFTANSPPGPYFIITDLHPPEPCAYYRFEAEFVPPAP